MVVPLSATAYLIIRGPTVGPPAVELGAYGMDGHSDNLSTRLDNSAIDRATSTSTPRRFAVQRLALISAGLAGLVGLSLTEAEAAPKKRKKKPIQNRCKCKPGTQGPPGPEGPPGPGTTPAEIAALFQIRQANGTVDATTGAATCTVTCQGGAEFYSVGGSFSSDLCTLSEMIQTLPTEARVSGRCPAGSGATLRCRGVCGPRITP
jgi:hypothetical protein